MSPNGPFHSGLSYMFECPSNDPRRAHPILLHFVTLTTSAEQ